MTALIANVVQATDTFGQWLSKTNQAITVIRTTAVTTNSNTAIGNAAVSGVFSANVLTANARADSQLRIGMVGAFSNLTANATTILIRTSNFSNTNYSANGMQINGTVLYTSDIMKIGNSAVRAGNVTSTAGYFNLVQVGNTILTNTAVSSDRANTRILLVSNNATIGDNQANTYMTRFGLEVYDNPTGVLVQNSKMTSTTLWIRDIFANNITTNTLIVNHIEANTGNYKVWLATPQLSVNTITSAAATIAVAKTTNFADDINVADAATITGALTVGGPSVFNGTTLHNGATNHFVNGLTSAGRVGIGPSMGPGANQPQTPLHIMHGPVAGGVAGINQHAKMVLDGPGHNIFQFRNSPDQGTFGGMIFSDNNNHSGYIAYRHWAPGTPYAAFAHIGGENGIAFGVGPSTENPGDPLPLKPIIMNINPTGATLAGTLLITNGTTSVGLSANPGGSPSFMLPPNVGSPGQILKANGSGAMYWDNLPGPPPIPGAGDCVQYRSLGVGVGNPGCQTGLIVASGDILAFYSDERLKDKVSDIDNALSKVKQLSGFIYTSNDKAAEYGYDDKEERVGLSAQDVQKVLPQAVKPAPFDQMLDEKTGDVVSKSGENYLTVQYEKLVPLLIEAIKELDDKLDSIKKSLGA